VCGREGSRRNKQKVKVCRGINEMGIKRNSSDFTIKFNLIVQT
jgi:hypothetical protein